MATKKKEDEVIEEKKGKAKKENKVINENKKKEFKDTKKEKLL